ncbi:MAG TPA: SPFH domain-containing protein [Patescibacteria group bacterium]|jgi:regulator of protease activity HflC (stomatin/prohibitin superfamily)|nr:SPFH domain-containing protein [Patescibacteria group bacterium]
MELIVVLIVAVGLLILLFAAIKVVAEYERGVIFRLGRVQVAKGPGLFFIIPIIDKMMKVDLRTITLDVPSQDAITADNVTVRVNAVVYFRVVDPVLAIINIEDYQRATWQIAQTSLRNVIGQSEIDQLLQERERINARLQHIIDEATEPWGIKVSIVEIKDVELDSTMVRAMARQAEAERERRARVIKAEGELQAATQLAEAAKLLQEQPASLTLRYLQTLLDIGVENNTTTIFPIPIELLDVFINHYRDKKDKS